MKFFTIVALFACWYLAENQTSAKNPTPNQVEASESPATYAVVDVAQGLFTGFDVILVKDSCEKTFVIFSATQSDTRATSLSERDSVVLTSGQKYTLNLVPSTFDSVPVPNVRTSWEALSIGIDLGDTTVILWQSGALTQQTYVSPNIRGHYYIPSRKE